MITYLKNCWYAAGLASELSVDGAIARTILGVRIALFRGAEGEPVALFDRCPHRFAQLHEGSVEAGVIECPYHGLRFDSSGACVRNPHGDGTIPPQARVTSYPVVERNSVIWIWPGAPDRVDMTMIPDLSVLDCDEPNAVLEGYMHTEANYELVTDNLMDLSHADYIHRETLNTGGSLTKIRPNVKAGDGSVRAYWNYETDNVQPFFLSALRDPGARCVQSFDMRWSPPSNLLLDATARNADQSPAENAHYTTAHLLTPETETTTHYFYRGVRSWDMANAELNAAFGAGFRVAFDGEDKPILYSVQESMETTDLWSLNPVILTCDPGPVHARRMLQRLIARENEVVAAVA